MGGGGWWRRPTIALARSSAREIPSGCHICRSHAHPHMHSCLTSPPSLSMSIVAAPCSSHLDAHYCHHASGQGAAAARRRLPQVAGRLPGGQGGASRGSPRVGSSRAHALSLDRSATRRWHQVLGGRSGPCEGECRALCGWQAARAGALTRSLADRDRVQGDRAHVQDSPPAQLAGALDHGAHMHARMCGVCLLLVFGRPHGCWWGAGEGVAEQGQREGDSSGESLLHPSCLCRVGTRAS